MKSKEKVPVVLVEGVAGYALYANDRRVYGNKPWGGSLRTKEGITIPVTSFWDIHEKKYTAKEITARYLRRKDYPISIHISFSNPRRPQYMFGYLRYSRYATIIMVI